MKRNNYTGLVQDLIDTANNDIDRVSGFTIKQLERTLAEVNNWDTWRRAVRRIYWGPKEDIDRLFDYHGAYNNYFPTPRLVP